MAMEWSEKLSIGNESIDSEHRNLISLTNGVIRAIETRSSSGLTRAFEQLEHGLCMHFENEEKIARAINFDFSHHKLAQRYMLGELRFLKGLLDTKNCLWFNSGVEHLSCFLENWVIDNHIIGLDMRMKPALQASPDGFSVGGAPLCS